MRSYDVSPRIMSPLRTSQYLVRLHTRVRSCLEANCYRRRPRTIHKTQSPRRRPRRAHGLNTLNPTKRTRETGASSSGSRPSSGIVTPHAFAAPAPNPLRTPSLCPQRRRGCAAASPPASPPSRAAQQAPRSAAAGASCGRSHSARADEGARPLQANAAKGWSEVRRRRLRGRW